jgi:hypothetical protein
MLWVQDAGGPTFHGPRQFTAERAGPGRPLAAGARAGPAGSVGVGLRAGDQAQVHISLDVGWPPTPYRRENGVGCRP